MFENGAVECVSRVRVRQRRTRMIRLGGEGLREVRTQCVSGEVARRLGDLRQCAAMAQQDLATLLEIHPDTLGERERGTAGLSCDDATRYLEYVEGAWAYKRGQFQMWADQMRPILEDQQQDEEERARAKAHHKWSRRKRVVVDGYYQEQFQPMREQMGISRVELARRVGVDVKVIYQREHPLSANPTPSRMLALLRALERLVGERTRRLEREGELLRSTIDRVANGEPEGMIDEAPRGEKEPLGYPNLVRMSDL